MVVAYTSIPPSARPRFSVISASIMRRNFPIISRRLAEANYCNIHVKTRPILRLQQTWAVFSSFLFALTLSSLVFAMEKFLSSCKIVLFRRTA